MKFTIYRNLPENEVEVFAYLFAEDEQSALELAEKELNHMPWIYKKWADGGKLVEKESKR